MKKLSIFIITLSIFTLGCKRDNKSYEGPSLDDINGTFSMITPFASSVNSADFSKGETVVFTAGFSKLCDWTITVYGKTSGAKKIITGKSKLVSAPWDGSTTYFPMFSKENCTVVLKIQNVSDSFVLNVTSTGVRIPTATIVADFESGLNPKWTSFIQSGANMDFKVKSDAFKVQGNNYLNMAGTVNWDWLIGLIDYPASALGSTTYNLSSNPSNVYFNCLIYGNATVANQSRVLFQFKEDDNANGKFDASADDEFDKEIIIDWTGWKLVSFKYSDLVHLVNGNPAANSGNNRQNSNNIVLISMLHLANPSQGAAATKIDFLSFTEGKPLEL